MTHEEFEKIWKASSLPLNLCKRIVGEIDMLMYDDDPDELCKNAAETRKLLWDLRYLSFISFRETEDLINYLEDTVEIRAHQLQGVKEMINNETL